MGQQDGPAHAQSEKLTVPESSMNLFRYILVATCMAFFNRAMPTPFLPLVLNREFGMPISEVGLVLAAYPVGAFVATRWSCNLARRTQHIMRLHSVAILVMASAALLFPLVHNLLIRGILPVRCAALAVGAVRAMQGFCQAIYLASNTSAVTRSFHDAVPYVVGMAEVSVGIGAQMGRLCGGPLYDLGGLPCPFIVTAGIQYVVGAVGFAFKDTGEVATEVGSAHQMAAKDIPLSKLMNSKVIVSSMAVLQTYLMAGLYDSTLPGHLENYLGPLSVSTLSVVTSARSIAYLTTSYVSAQLLQRDLVSLEVLTTAGFAFLALGYFTAAPAPALVELAPLIFEARSGCWTVMVLSMFLSSIGGAMLFVPSLPLMQREVNHLGRHAEEQVAMVFMSAMSIGEAFGPILGGWLVDSYGFAATTGTFMLITLSFMACALSVYDLKVRHRAEDLGQPPELASPLLRQNLPSKDSRKPIFVGSDLESAYAYRRIPFVLGNEHSLLPGSAPPVAFRRQYDPERAAAVLKNSTAPATMPANSRRPFQGSQSRVQPIDFQESAKSQRARP